MTDSEPSADGRVTLEIDGPIAVITLDRPHRLNSMTLTMIRQLFAAMEEAQDDPQVRAIVLTGAGTRAFCAGGDLQELIPRFTSGHIADLIPDPSQRFFSKVYKPIVAAVHGVCIAGGMEMLLGTDLRIVSDSAIFGLAETRWGIIPAAGSHVRLPQQVSWAIAMQLLLTAEPIGARRAYEVGLVNEVLPVEDVLPRAFAVARQLAGNGPVAVQAAKEIAVRALENGPRFAMEHDINRRVLATDDAKEGPRAFTEKRAPVYEGH